MSFNEYEQTIMPLHCTAINPGRFNDQYLSLINTVACLDKILENKNINFNIFLLRLLHVTLRLVKKDLRCSAITVISFSC